MEAVKHIHIEKLSIPFLEGLIGIGAVILAIVGLFAILPLYMAGIATIVIGVAFFFDGFASIAKYRTVPPEIAQRPFEMIQLGWGTTAEFLGGVAGIVLGILALLNVYPLTLVPITALIYGVTLIFSSSMTAWLNETRIEQQPEQEQRRIVAREAVLVTADIQIFVGLAALVLGILSLLGTYPLVLSLTALLAVAFSDLFSGTELVGRLVRFFRY
jgi:hypothetical protein